MEKVVDLRYDHCGVYARKEDDTVACYPWVYEDEEIPENGKVIEVSERHGVRAFEIQEDAFDWSKQWNRKRLWASDDKKSVIDQINA